MNLYKEGLKKNIFRYFLFEFFWTLVFFYPISQLFYLVRNMSITEIAFIGVAFYVARMAMEVPSGILADKWGRKKTLFVSQIFFIIAMFILIFSHSLWFFIIASIFSGFWFAFYSGTATAFFYDTLKELKKRKEYEKYAGRINLFTAVVGFFVAFSAGFLFEASIIIPYILSAISALLSLFVVASFAEPKLHRSSKSDNIFSHFSKSMGEIIKNKSLGFIVIFGAILAFSLDYILSYGQIYLKLLEVPVVFFGIIFAVRSIIEGVGAFSANSIKNKLGYRFTLTFSIICVAAILFGLSFIKSYIGIFIFLLSSFIMGMFRLVQRGYIHKKIQSHNRATVDSISSFLMAGVIILFEPVAGYIADTYSIQISFLILGCILLVYIFYYLLAKFPKKELFNH